ncbi:uncharacterized protein LOC126907395 [Daktulosphaira vitifoliae]|uniref:uncharacterized protein LOC126907395 n=1 Tax=Daktulosphaira vitifoliae TaxID=58002 RepID=UPI0021AA8D7A|nr:uncharacterized protein LOC126907395 [Daktulosphaira vitifoliae]
MSSLKLVNFSFLLCYAIFYSKAYTTSKNIINQLDNLLNFYPGWKNLNDLIAVKYYHKRHYLNSLIKTPTSKYKCESKIRVLTVFLECTYTKVINNIFSIIITWLQINETQNKEYNDLINGCIYTEVIKNIMAILIVPIAKLMKGALEALDLLHHLPWATTTKMYQHKKPYIMCLLLERIENILDELNDPILSCDDRSKNSSEIEIEILFDFFVSIRKDLQKETDTLCEFVTYNTNYLWNEYVQEYRAIINQGVNLLFFKFLTKKIEVYIKTEIIEKYFELGFKFDPITEETFIPTPEETLELELEFKAIDEELPNPIQI